MSPTNSWTDERIDDFMERYREDREEFRDTLKRIESKVDARRWTMTHTVALFGPLGVAMIGAVAMILTKGGPG